MADNGQATAAGPAPATAPAPAPALQPTSSADSPHGTTAAPSEEDAHSDEVHSDDSHPPPRGRPGGVNVKEAEAQFAELGRALSQQSRAARGDKDLEADDDEFNLEDFLASTTSATSRAGIKRKRLGVIWNDVEVVGAGSMTLGVRTFPDAVIQNFSYPVVTLLSLFGVKLFDFGERKLLRGFEGALKPGEMCLVLGRPNAGCSTFLKTITHNHSGYGAVKGSIKYGGIDGAEFAQHYRGELVYNEEDDQHYPTLTVAETIMLALRLKTPGKRVEGQTAHDYRQQILTTVLKMLNIEHTRDTKVGNAFVRGVSGGERKRVSIAEMLCSRASILAWDNASRGLDASTALDLAKSLRVLANIIQTPTFVTLYQAGEGIWEQFDKVMVIDDGRCVYFGPRTEARQYFIDLGFEDMPRQTSADYCTGCTDKYTRRFAAGRDESNTPSTPEQLEAAFRESDIFKREQQAKIDYEAQVAQDKSWTEEFKQAVVEDKARGVRKQSKYTVSFFEQVRALTIRQFCMIMGDKRDIFVSYATALAIALITGSLFYQLPVTSSGAFTRGGVLFIALLFNSLTAFSELPTQMGGRPILYRQSGFAFFRPSALTISQLAADVPFGVPRLTAFAIIVYFMAGLQYSAGAFFIFLLNIVIGYYAFRALFALFGTICESYDVAARLAAVIIVALVVFAGYVAPRDAMPRWLFWISYMNPVYYGFEALMINEFMRLDLLCESIVPSGAGYPSGLGANQVCTLAGSTPGNPIVPGMDYLTAAFGYQRWHLWLNFGVTVIFFVGFTAITCACLELMPRGGFNAAMVIKKKPNAEEKKLDERLEQRRASAEKEEVKIDVEGRAFTWEKLCYTVPVKGGERQLLNSVDGYCKPGTLTALMGASGAGKTTLLDVLADRKSVGKIEGDRLIEGKPVGLAFQRGCGYAEQQDIHEHTATVREALRFSANLRQEFDVPQEKKDQFVEDIIELLELDDIANAMIGFPGFGLGVADRKRATIAVELAAKPNQLLFLDEPTSGLDGQGAYTIVRLLRKLAAAGMTILCTIHQPSSLLFENFDRLLLLERGGKTVYFGPVGKDSQELVKYFEEQGAPMAKTVNPAEAMLEIIGAGSQKRVGPRDWADVYLDSKLYQENLREIEQIKEHALANPRDEGKILEYATPYMYQLKQVFWRTAVSSWRQPDYQFTRLFQHAAIALITGLLFLQLGNSVETLQYRVFSLFMVAVLPALILAQIEPFYIMARGTFMREDSSKMYRGTVFAGAQILAEVPYSIACALVYFLLFYYVAGFQSGSDRAGYFFAMLILVEFFATSLGQLVAAVNPSIYLASVWNPFLTIIFSLFCGVTIPKPSIQAFWRAWMYWLNPVTYIISGLVTNELEGLEIRCKPSEFAIFQPPAPQTCAQWAGEFLSRSAGYLANPDATSNCEYCSYTQGSDFTKTLDIKFSERGRNIGIVIAFIAFNFVALLTASRFLRFANR